MNESIQVSIFISSLVAWVVNWMEASKLPLFNWVTKNSPWVTKSIMAVAATLHSAGVAWTFTGGVLTISGLSLTAILHFVVSAGYNFIVQHLVYKTVVVQHQRSTDALPPAK